jgi:hypothetical protein
MEDEVSLRSIMRRRHHKFFFHASFGVGAALATTACGSGSSGSASTCPTESGNGCWPEADRVDTYTPAFSKPTEVTNPQFPIKDLKSVLFIGTVDGKPFRTETTLLPDTRDIAWHGKKVTTLTSQYFAYKDGRIDEVAIDWYAQDDKGAVWYFGEDVQDYKDGVIVTKEGTWITDKEGPPAMIMPAHPRAGQVFRSEDAAPTAFEEVRIKDANASVDGPLGPVTGCVLGDELHMDETHDDKIFCPGYGEYRTGSGADVEAMSLAISVDSLAPGAPPELDTLSAGAEGFWNAVDTADLSGASAALRKLTSAWAAVTATAPKNLATEMDRAMAAADEAVKANDSVASRQASIDAERWALDLRLRHMPVLEVDRGRFRLWLRQVFVDVDAGSTAGVVGDAATLEWIRDRIRQTFDAATRTSIDGKLDELRTAADAGDLDAAKGAAGDLQMLVPAQGM